MPKRISRPEGYTPPSEAEIAAAAKEAKIENYDVNLVEDLCNYTAGGKPLPPQAFETWARQQARVIMSDKNFKTEPGLDSEQVEREIANRLIRQQKSVGDFITGLDLRWFPGDTPAEKAMSLFKLVEEMNKEYKRNLNISRDTQLNKKQADDVFEQLRKVDKLTPQEKKLLRPGKAKAKDEKPFKLNVGENSGERQHKKPDELKENDEKKSAQKKRDGSASGDKPKPEAQPDKLKKKPEDAGKKPQEDPKDKTETSDPKKKKPEDTEPEEQDKKSDDAEKKDKPRREKKPKGLPGNGPGKSDKSGGKEKSQEDGSGSGDSDKEKKDKKDKSGSGSGNSESEDGKQKKEGDSQPGEGEGESQPGEGEGEGESQGEGSGEGDGGAGTGDGGDAAGAGSSAGQPADAAGSGSGDGAPGGGEGSDSGGGSPDDPAGVADDTPPGEEVDKTGQGANPTIGGAGSGSAHKDLSALEVGDDSEDRYEFAKDLMPGGMMETMLETSRTIDKFESLAITKRQGTKPDPNGEEVRRRLMKDISEVGRVVPTDLAWRNVNRTYWRYRLASHKCVVREKITRYARKQIIFILLDGSGSMGNARKHWRASGVVMNRLKAVLSGDAELWLSVFDTRMSAVHHAATEQEALDLMEGFMKNNFTGGGTNIAASVRAAHEYIVKLMETRSELERPELWVLTDEDQSVSSLKPREVEGTRVNAMVFGATNKTLCKFAQETGGVAFENY